MRVIHNVLHEARPRLLACSESRPVVQLEQTVGLVHHLHDIHVMASLTNGDAGAHGRWWVNQQGVDHHSGRHAWCPSCDV